MKFTYFLLYKMGVLFLLSFGELMSAFLLTLAWGWTKWNTVLEAKDDTHIKQLEEKLDISNIQFSDTLVYTLNYFFRGKWCDVYTMHPVIYGWNFEVHSINISWLLGMQSFLRSWESLMQSKNSLPVIQPNVSLLLF